MTATMPVVLVVDDMPETRRLMRRLLERDRMRVLEADSGESALRTIASSRPDLVVLDLRLPGISGQEVARRVRSTPDPTIASTVPLACSASIQPEVRADALAAGCDEFTGKPLDIATFSQRIRSLIEDRAGRS